MLRLSLTRCADVACAQPATVTLPDAQATVAPRRDLAVSADGRDPDDAGLGRPLDPSVAAALGVATDAQGRPIVLLNVSGTAWIGTCATEQCAGGTFARVTTPNQASPTVRGSGVQSVVLLSDGVVRTCGGRGCAGTYLVGGQDPGDGALGSAPGGGIDVVLSSIDDDGHPLVIGSPLPDQRVLTLWQCADQGCRRPAGPHWRPSPMAVPRFWR